MKIKTNRIEDGSAISAMPWILPVIVWFAVVAWRPWFTGFYHDDWTVLQPLSHGNALKLFEEQASRPIYALLLVSVRLVLPMDPFYYQGLLVILLACSALAIGLFAQRLANHFVVNTETASWAGAVSASIWLATPWDLGVSVWPTTFPAQISVIGFCIVGAITLGNDSTRAKLEKALPTFLAISLISELFWLSFIPLTVLLIALGSGFIDWRKQKETVLLFVGFGAVQVFLGAFNRLLVFFDIGTNRSFNPSFIDTTLLSLRLLPSEFSRAVVFPQLMGSIVIFLLVGIVICAIFHKKRNHVFGVLIGIGVGCLISTMLFALARYRVESIGVFSRTTIVITVWLSLIPALAIAVTEKVSSWIKWSLRGITILLLVGFSLSSVINLQGWIRSWEFQKDLLRSFPAEEIVSEAEYDSFILVDAARPENSVEGLEGFWDLGDALLSQYPVLKVRIAREILPGRPRRFATVLDRNNKQTSWDGVEVVQSWCHSPNEALWRLPAPSQVYLWNYSAQQFTRLDNPVQLGCEKSR